uniref:Cytochrome P450 n=1 Tax=Scoparia dulcis TaxID=107240 RepID=A0A1W7HBU8_SCODU
MGLNIPSLQIISFILSLLCLASAMLLLKLSNGKKKKELSISKPNKSPMPKSYPIIGSFLAILENSGRILQWTSDILLSTSHQTFSLHLPFGQRLIFTANAANVQHILKSNFHVYEKGDFIRTALKDILGDSIVNVDGDEWKFQRQISIHEFNTKSFRKFVGTVVDSELADRLIPILKTAAAKRSVLDLQDILQRFAFDNICQVAFGYDPAYLLPSLPQAEFTDAFDEAVKLCSERMNAFTPQIWKVKRALNIGSEKQLRIAVNHAREFVKEIIRKKKKPNSNKNNNNADVADKTLESADLLSRFLNSNHSDEDFVTDVVMGFILAGRDSTSAALTWFFWLLSHHPEVENEILKEISELRQGNDIDDQTSRGNDIPEAKEMIYTHAALCETMRLYPPLPMDQKEAVSDDVLPDGTVVKKGTRVGYHIYAMGRVETVWGKDWAMFSPTRWLEREEGAEKWKFVGRDQYTYPVFQAGPRICLGKEMAFLQMKRAVAEVLRRFRVVPVMEKGTEPILITKVGIKMKGGFPVRIEERAQ